MSAGLKLTVQLKHHFFDRAKVMAAVARAGKRNLSRAAAFVRTAARSSLRRRKRVSSPGSPPSVHSRDPVANLKFILFAYEPFTQTAVVGPVKLNQAFVVNGFIMHGTVPETLEYGGEVGIREKEIRLSRTKTKWVPTGRRQPRPGQATRVRQARYEARPFMRPALAQEAPKFPDLWSNSVKAA